MNINLQAPINGSGYGVAGLQFALGLNRLGHQVAWWPLGAVNADEVYRPILTKLAEHRKLFDPTAPSLKIWHQFDMASSIGRGKRIGMPIFELDPLTESEIHHLDSLDKIFVCSKWAKNIVFKCLPHRLRDVFVVPLGVDRDIFHENVSQPEPFWTTFINVGKWEIRKGHDILPAAFARAFQIKDRARLWMMNDNIFLTQAEHEEWQERYKQLLGHRVSFIPRVKTQQEVAKVMGETHCGVFPARAEGWNLEVLEMLSMGKKVITTGYSGNTEFSNCVNSRIIEIDELEPAHDGKWFHGEGEWGRFGEDQMEQLVNHLRAVHKEVQQMPYGVNTEGIRTAERFTWKLATQKLVEAVQAPQNALV